MKKILLSVIVLSGLLTGCLKDTTIKNDLDKRSTIFMVQNSGLEFFSSRAVVAAGQVDPITSSFTTNVANADDVPLSKDVTVTFVVDDAARLAYNALPSPALDYDALPDSVYSFAVKTAVIKAGTNLATLSVVFDPNKIDPSKSYMLAITLKDAQGMPISQNFSTVYYHIIGNPLAGKYTHRFRRFQVADTTGVPLQDITSTTVLLPVSPTAIMSSEDYTTTFVDANGGILVNFINTGGVLSNFTTSLNTTTLDGITAGGFILLGGPKFTSGGVFVAGNVASNFIGTRFNTYIQYQNSSGGTRTLINNFVKIP
jgi:Domain of unknown function (DUF1735)